MIWHVLDAGGWDVENKANANGRGHPGRKDAMNRTVRACVSFGVAVLVQVSSLAHIARAEGDWEITAQSDKALARGLDWLARNQGPDGNWQSNDLGLVSTGALAFLSAGHLPGRGRHGQATQRALDYVVRGAEQSGVLNVANPRRAMYNHGLSAFVLGQAYGMTSDQRVGPALDRALKLIAQTQCGDGGWDYMAVRKDRGHDLSLAVMQAKALRSAVDSGLEVPPEVVELAIASVRRYYTPKGCSRDADEETQKKHPGQFTYSGGGGGTLAMAAAGVVCMQEFGQYDDWRIEKSMEVITAAVRKDAEPDQAKKKRQPPLSDAYTLYYVGQALYQVGGEDWRQCYPLLRDSLVASQLDDPKKPEHDGMWRAGGRVHGKPGEMYMTAVACFILAMPNRYLPILQEGRIESVKKQFGKEP